LKQPSLSLDILTRGSKRNIWSFIS
jgi:hypothetical protein